jgi:hypothetical protein
MSYPRKAVTGFGGRLPETCQGGIGNGYTVVSNCIEYAYSLKRVAFSPCLAERSVITSATLLLGPRPLPAIATALPKASGGSWPTAKLKNKNSTGTPSRAWRVCFLTLMRWCGGNGGSGWIRTNGSLLRPEDSSRSGDYKSPALSQLSHAAMSKCRCGCKASVKTGGRGWGRTNDLQVSSLALYGGLIRKEPCPAPLSYTPTGYNIAVALEMRECYKNQMSKLYFRLGIDKVGRRNETTTDFCRCSLKHKRCFQNRRPVMGSPFLLVHTEPATCRSQEL